MRSKRSIFVALALLQFARACQQGSYGSAENCTRCPANATTGEAGNRNSLSCRCAQGFALLATEEPRCVESSDCSGGMLDPVSMKCWLIPSGSQSDTAKNWQSKCLEFGADLASIVNGRDYVFLYNLYWSLPPRWRVWLGAYASDSILVGGRTWETNKPWEWLDGSSWYIPSSYWRYGSGNGGCTFFFAFGECGSSLQDKLGCSGLGKWACNIIVGSMNYGAVCSKPSSLSLQTTTTVVTCGDCEFKRTVEHVLERNGTCQSCCGTLDLSNTALVSLSSNVFAGLGCVTTLDLSNNRLVHMDNGALQGLANLTSLDVSGNGFVDFSYYDGSRLLGINALQRLRVGQEWNKCPPGSYGVTTCSLCPPGSTSTAGETACECPADFYWTGAACVRCPATATSVSGQNFGVLACRCPAGFALRYDAAPSCVALSDCDGGVVDAATMKCWWYVEEQDLQGCSGARKDPCFQLHCASWGGGLASIVSVSDLEVAAALYYSRAEASPGVRAVIGAQRNTYAGEWFKWADGSEWRMVEDMWYPGEPRNLDLWKPQCAAVTGFRNYGLAQPDGTLHACHSNSALNCFGMVSDGCTWSAPGGIFGLLFSAGICSKSSQESVPAVLSDRCQGCELSRDGFGSLVRQQEGSSSVCSGCCGALNLRGRVLSALHPRVFDGFSCVQELDLADNRLMSLDPTVFRGLTNLSRLDLARNPIDPALTGLQFGVFQGLDKLQFLRLAELTWNQCPSSTYGDGLQCAHCPPRSSSSVGSNFGVFSCECAAGLTLVRGLDPQCVEEHGSECSGGVWDAVTQSCWTAAGSCAARGFPVASILSAREMQIAADLYHAVTRIDHLAPAQEIFRSVKVAAQDRVSGADRELNANPVTHDWRWTDGAPWTNYDWLWHPGEAFPDRGPLGCAYVVSARAANGSCPWANTAGCMFLRPYNCAPYWVQGGELCKKYAPSVAARVVHETCAGCTWRRNAYGMLVRDGGMKEGEGDNQGEDGDDDLVRSGGGSHPSTWNRVRRSGGAGCVCSEVDLASLHLRGIEPGVFEGVESLRHLDLSSNAITTFDAQHIAHLADLEFLSLSGIVLMSVARDTFAPLTQLRRLELAQCNIIDIAPLAFSELHHLETLSLKGNRIAALEKNAFWGLTKLAALDLGHNRIQRLSHAAFNGLTRLEILQLQHNAIPRMEPGTLDSLPALAHLRARSNAGLKCMAVPPNSVQTLTVDFDIPWFLLRTVATLCMPRGCEEHFSLQLDQLAPPILADRRTQYGARGEELTEGVREMLVAEAIESMLRFVRSDVERALDAENRAAGMYVDEEEEGQRCWCMFRRNCHAQRLCQPGKQLVGEGCVDVDECAAGTHNCDRARGRCANTDGSFTCTCADPGWWLGGDAASCQPPPECGNGILECGEQCDGHDSAECRCTEACTCDTCGDGVVDLARGEECDHAQGLGDAGEDEGQGGRQDPRRRSLCACSACRCVADNGELTCGNGVVEEWEECDPEAGADEGDDEDEGQVPLLRRSEPTDGHRSWPDGGGVGGRRNGCACSSACRCEGPAPECGNGELEDGEECEYSVKDSGCERGVCSECQCVDDEDLRRVERSSDKCGNSHHDVGEECDFNQAGGCCQCNAECRCEADTVETNPHCGNGRLEPEFEQCDESDLAVGVRGCGECENCFCSAHPCGNGVLDRGEECDPRIESGQCKCSFDCKCLDRPVCGNGRVEGEEEECDDANGVGSDACVACQHARCGDGWLWAGVEECDDESVWCVAGTCRLARCGDGVVLAGAEECDEGSSECTPACRFATCSDGLLNQDEEFADCGGALCEECSCNDGRVNQDEEEVDCGGVCPPCQECPAPYSKQGTACCDDTVLGLNEQFKADPDGACGVELTQACPSPEGYHCPSIRTSVSVVECRAGYYCAGGNASEVPCTCDEGFYCPAVYTPFADGQNQRRESGQQPLGGRRCPPNMYCAGNTSQPVALPLGLCDLAQSCGGRLLANQTCGVKQSTFHSYNDPAAGVAVDGDASTCMKTATADTDENPQWLRVALEVNRLVLTVRFWSTGEASDFEVVVTTDDQQPVDVLSNGAERANPSVGGELPVLQEACTVTPAGSGSVFEAKCPPATKGNYVFVRRATAKTVLEVCELEVFDHVCVSDEQLSCPLGSEPSACTAEDALCRGCVPCPPGTYSDKVGSYQCTPCPGHALYDEIPYSPEGSTSVFQCMGDAYLDGTSTLDATDVAFNQTLDAWEIDIEYSEAPHVQIRGLAALFMSDGGDVFDSKIYKAKNFPCRADTTEAAGDDHSASLEETVCCLQDMRLDYVMTNIFRKFTDGLNLVAANDICDSEAGSNELVNADLDVVAEDGTTFFVNTEGESFAHSITVVPIECTSATLTGRRSHDNDNEGKLCARITIPDAELYKVSKTLNPDQNLTDARELFIGLLDMLPTGTRVVDSSSQQISVVLIRTQYGTFAAYGEQNIDYDFISYLNARVHKVIGTGVNAYYAEISFVYDDRLHAQEGYPVAFGSVMVDYGESYQAACTGGDTSLVDLGDFMSALQQTCGPDSEESDLDWDAHPAGCAQAELAADKFAQLYIPLWTDSSDPSAGTVKIKFNLAMADGNPGLTADLAIELNVVVGDYVTWCDEDSGSVDLTKDVAPSLIIGTDSSNPSRITNFPGSVESETLDESAFPSEGLEVETLQDGLITMVLDITKEEENLEIFFEDVMIVQVNPGSVPDIDDLKDATPFKPSFKYGPDSRDAWMIIPSELHASCPEATFSESFFGCVHKHLLKDEKITNPEWAYLVGSDMPPPAGAQDFMETMLGSGTARVAARELGRDYEGYLVSGAENIGTKSKIGLWINPGHVWGQEVHNSKYSLSQYVIVYVLYGIKSGVDGTVTRRLLQATPNGNTMVTRTLKYDVTAASLIESVLDNVVAVQVEASLPLSATEACKSEEELLELCSARLQAAVAPHASSKVAEVACVSTTVQGADCDRFRRAPSHPVAVVEAVIALEASPDASIDLDAVVAAGGVLAIKQTAGKPLSSPDGKAPSPDEKVQGTPAASGEESGPGSSTMLISAVAGAAGGVVLAALVTWSLRALKQSRTQSEQLTEVTAGAAEPVSEKARIERLLFSRDQ